MNGSAHYAPNPVASAIVSFIPATGVRGVYQAPSRLPHVASTAPTGKRDAESRPDWANYRREDRASDCRAARCGTPVSARPSGCKTGKYRSGRGSAVRVLRRRPMQMQERGDRGATTQGPTGSEAATATTIAELMMLATVVGAAQP